MKFSLHKRYNFITIAPAILGGRYSNMRVISILNAQEANKYRDIYTLHEQVKASLENNIQVSDLTYIVFEDMAGTKLVLPNEYIVQDSIILVDSIKILIEVPDANTEDLSILREKLKELGYIKCKLQTIIV